TATAGAYALVGMGTLFAGIVRAPMTSVLMIFEITQDYAVIVPLMISNLVSFFISSRLQHEPIYDVLAYQDGIHLPARAARLGSTKHVAQFLRPADELLQTDTTVDAALLFANASRRRSWPVCDKEGVIGVLNRQTLEHVAEQGGRGKQLVELL